MKWFNHKKDNHNNHEIEHVDTSTSDDASSTNTPKHSKKHQKKIERGQKKRAKQQKKSQNNKHHFDWSRHRADNNNEQDSRAQSRQVRTRGLFDPNAAGQDESSMQFLDDYEAADQDFNKYTQSQYISLITFPYLATKKERANLYKAHVSVVDSKRLLLERTIVTLFLGIGFMFAAMVFFKLNFFIALLVGLVVGLISWYALSSSIKKNYGNFKINRQIAFNLFEKILSPNLHRVREGSNLTNILETVSKQLPQAMYRHYVDRLVIDIHLYPGSKEPFDNFAHTFSGGENSEYDALVFTNALYQLTQGKDSIDTVYQLLAQSDRQLAQQQDKIMKIKQKPFKGVQYLLFATFFPFTIAYYATTILSYISSFHM